MSRFLVSSLAALLLAACGSVPTEPARPRQPTFERFQRDLGGGVSVDYQIERKISGLNGKTCYAFITGVLANQSGRTLSKRTILDFNVFGNGQQLFRDLTSPVRDVGPGERVMFEMIDSPVHRDGCPNYDRIEIGLRPVNAG